MPLIDLLTISCKRPATKAQKRHLHGLGILQHKVIEAMTIEEATEAIKLSRKMTHYEQPEKIKKDVSSQNSIGDTWPD